jgi:hypothetical protein
MKNFKTVGDQKALDRQRAIALHYVNIDTQELNRLATDKIKVKLQDLSLSEDAFDELSDLLETRLTPQELSLFAEDY